MAKQKYDASSITVLDPLDGVRSHPGMYLGSIDANGTFQALKEILDNAKDELTTIGSGKILIDIIAKKGTPETITVADSGRGVPIDRHKRTKLSALETVFTRLHAGAKSGSKSSYGKTSIGVHGVGAAVTNALSSKFEVWTNRSGWHYQAYEKGKPVTKLVKRQPPLRLSKGTVVRYTRDNSILLNALDIASVTSYCHILSHFYKIEVSLTYNGKTKVYVPKPTIALVDKYIIAKNELARLTDTFVYSEGPIKLVMAWAIDSEERIFTFVNGSPTTGGTHAIAFNNLVSDILAKQFKSKMKDVSNLAGICAIFDITIDQPSFEGQAKTRLANKTAKDIVISNLEKPLAAWVKRNKSYFDKVIEHLVDYSAALKKSKEIIKLASSVKSKSKGTSLLPIKLMSSAPETRPEQRELYLLEGDSAAGSARIARLRNQECLPLRGKLPNLIKDGSKALSNSEIHDIMRCVGFDPKNPDTPLRISKLIFLADADVDGQHISVLMLTMAYTLMRKMFANKQIYIVVAPLYIAKNKKNEHVYGNSLQEIKTKGGVKHIERLKGWGSCSPELLQALAFDPKTRVLLAIDPPTKEEGRKFEALMGGDSAARKELVNL